RSAFDPKHWELRGHLLELGQTRILVNWQMRPRAGCPLQVGLQHGGTLVCGDLFKVYLLTPSVTQSHIATCRLHISHPFHLRPEHGDKVALSFDGNHDERQTDQSPGSPAPHLQSYQIVRSNPERVDRGPAPVDYGCLPIGAPTAIQPFLQIHRSRNPNGPPVLRISPER